MTEETSFSTSSRGITRRSLLASSAILLPLVQSSANAATWNWQFFINVNLQGLEGGDVVPGVLGTNYFAPSASDIAYVTARTTGASRLPFRWERMQPAIGGPLDPTYLGQVRAVAVAAASVNRTVILDCHNYMHRTVDGVDRYVDNADGVLTRAHLADLWSKIATAFAGVAGVSGYDIMNEPQGAFGASGSSQDLALIMQACVNAIDAVDRQKAIFIEGGGWSSAANWVANNTSYPLADKYNRLVYSAHCYPDFDGSGTHFDYASQLANKVPTSVLVDRSTGFAQWLKTNKLRGHIGETNVGIDDRRWLTVLSTGLSFWKAHGIAVSLWMFAANFGPNPYNLYPYSGSPASQWPTIKQFL